MPARIKKAAGCLLLILLLTLSGCRVRTGLDAPAAAGQGNGTVGQAPASEQAGEAGGSSQAEAIPGEGSPEGASLENPGARRKEYDENAAAEIIAGANRAIQQEGEGSAAAHPAPEAEAAAAQLHAEAEKTATQTLPSQEAERMGASEDADMADSAFTYYSVLLRQRAASLFECKRLTVYWETPEDHRTVFKTSPEHQLIIAAGAYDVSARLLEQNLRVDDGWIQRKNPGVIVKAVDSGILGGGVLSDSRAQALYAAMAAREGWNGIDAARQGRVLLISQEMMAAPHMQLAAMLLLAKTANPDLYEDVDPQQALRMLTEEAAGSAAEGVYWYVPAQERTP